PGLDQGLLHLGVDVGQGADDEVVGDEALRGAGAAAEVLAVQRDHRVGELRQSRSSWCVALDHCACGKRRLPTSVAPRALLRGRRWLESLTLRSAPTRQARGPAWWSERPAYYSPTRENGATVGRCGGARRNSSPSTLPRRGAEKGRA